MSGAFLSVLCVFGVLALGACDPDDGVRPDLGSVDGVTPQPDTDTRQADGAKGGQDGDRVPPISLPADEQPHSTQMEWWYYTGLLHTEDGRRVGFEAVVFQMILAGKPLYVNHSAFSDLRARRHVSAMEVAVDDQRHKAVGGFDLEVGALSMKGGGGSGRITTAAGDYELSLTLESTKPATIQYGRGYMYIGSDDPFYYYSYTNMDARGTLTVDGKPFVVTGRAWMDHQWGTIGRDFGWDWFSLRLDDDTELMLFLVRRGGKTGFVGGTHIGASGETTELTRDDFSIVTKGKWKSPHTQITYPQNWQITVPSLGIDVSVSALLEDQEFNKSAFDSPIYWEGLCDVSGTRNGEPLTGHAYVELTGDKS